MVQAFRSATNNDAPFDPTTYNPGLWEFLPSQVNRSQDNNAGIREKRQIPPGPFFTTQGDVALAGTSTALQNTAGGFRYSSAVSQGWKEYRHPAKGGVFFYNQELHIVTDAIIWDERVLRQVMSSYDEFVALRDHVLPQAAAFDVFLDCSSEGSCRYYMIDHFNKTVCWLRERTTSDLGISDISNVLHLRALLNEEYWMHAESMPIDENHLGSSIVELQATLKSTALDHMTSEGSTSPFTAEVCNAYLLALDKAAAPGHMIHLNWSTARIMGLLVHRRNIDWYGRSGTRLDYITTAEGKRRQFYSSPHLDRSKVLGGPPGHHIDDISNSPAYGCIPAWRAHVMDVEKRMNTVSETGPIMASPKEIVEKEVREAVAKAPEDISFCSSNAEAVKPSMKNDEVMRQSIDCGFRDLTDKLCADPNNLC